MNQRGTPYFVAAAFMPDSVPSVWHVESHAGGAYNAWRVTPIVSGASGGAAVQPAKINATVTSAIRRMRLVVVTAGRRLLTWTVSIMFDSSFDPRAPVKRDGGETPVPPVDV